VRRVTPIILSLTLAACASNQGLFSGENLLQPMPLPEDSWVPYENQDGSLYQQMWSKNDHNDQLKTDVFHRTPNRSVEREKLIDDKVGKEKCSKFESSSFELMNQTKYESLTWFSSCKTSAGIEISVLHKAISGSDSFYHLRRIWKLKPSQDQITLWREYFSTVQVCDTRSQGVDRCPDGYSKVQ